MATLTYVFDPYCPRSASAAPAVLALWEANRSVVHFETVHAGTRSSWFGPDSERSARAFSALRAAAPALELPLMHEFHQALRRDRVGRRVLIGIAQRLGIDPAAVFDALRHPDRGERARAELERGRALQLGDGPTLLFEHDHIITSVPPHAPTLEGVLCSL